MGRRLRARARRRPAQRRTRHRRSSPVCSIAEPRERRRSSMPRVPRSNAGSRRVSRDSTQTRSSTSAHRCSNSSSISLDERRRLSRDRRRAVPERLPVRAAFAGRRTARGSLSAPPELPAHPLVDSSGGVMRSGHQRASPVRSRRHAAICDARLPGRRRVVRPIGCARSARQPCRRERRPAHSSLGLTSVFCLAQRLRRRAPFRRGLVFRTRAAVSLARRCCRCRASPQHRLRVSLRSASGAPCGSVDTRRGPRHSIPFHPAAAAH